jgi:hypothetical protein
MQFQNSVGLHGAVRKRRKSLASASSMPPPGWRLADNFRIEHMTLAVVAGHRFADDDVGIAFQAAALRTIRLEARHIDAARRARVALRAVRKIQVTTGAAKAVFQRRAVQLVKLRRGRIDHQVLRRALGVIAAGVRQGLEQADVIGGACPILCLAAPWQGFSGTETALDDVHVAQYHHGARRSTAAARCAARGQLYVPPRGRPRVGLRRPPVPRRNG